MLKGFVVPLRCGTDASKTTASLQAQSSGQRAVGPKYSVNVLGGQNVWLYKPGAPGRDLGTLDRCGPDAIQTLLQDAAVEFGRMAR